MFWQWYVRRVSTVSSSWFGSGMWDMYLLYPAYSLAVVCGMCIDCILHIVCQWYVGCVSTVSCIWFGSGMWDMYLLYRAYGFVVVHALACIHSVQNISFIWQCYMGRVSTVQY